ncbi:MAG TPA: MFS transporter [Ktedonosporobacter sp.]|nr:MFS transporter [Ktedonosporobacter sp.]
MSPSTHRLTSKGQCEQLAAPPDKQVETDGPKWSWISALVGVLYPLRMRNYRLLFIGQLISNIGDAFYVVALPWFMLSSGGGVQALGVVLAAYGIPRVAGVLLGGPLSDRLRPRRLMLLTDSVRALLTGILAVLVLQGHPPLWLLCVISAFLGAFSGLFTPAAWSITPDVLSDEDLQAGNALTTSSLQIALFVGSAIAGIVVSRFQSGIAFVIDALSFVVSAFTLAAMHNGRGLAQVHHRADEQEALSVSVAGIKEADAPQSPMTFWQLMRTSRYLRILLIMVIFMNMGNGGAFGVALPELAHSVLRSGASGYGTMLAAFSIGAFAGALVAGTLGKIPRMRMLALSFFLVQACAVTFVPFAGSVVAASCALAVGGVMNGLGNVTSGTLIQQALPRHLMGRFMGALAFANFGSYPLSAGLASIVVAHYGPIPIFLISESLIIGPCIFGLFQREFQQ